MACLLNSESRRLYSWWWDSHISPKNSKWLQENLTDMDTKVKSMIKLIEEDADSFARRAEMYYKKRPELMKLVEEFYRAYRALAERYDYATGELRHAQRTLQAAFPNQEPLGLPDDLPEGHRMLLEGKSNKTDFEGIDEKDEREFRDFGDVILSESKRADKAECEVKNLKKELADILAEKESILAQYQESLERFSNADRERIHALEKSRILEEKAMESEKEVRMLKETLRVLQVEKDTGLSKQMEYLETISDLEEKLELAKVEAKGTDNRAFELMNKLSILESENDKGLLQYGKCLDKISVLEKKISVTESDAKMFSEQASKAELEVEKLKKDLFMITEEKEALRVLYSECLEKSYNLELDLSSAQDDVQRLTNEILTSMEKIRSVEEICVRLENSNRSLKMEASELAKKIMSKDRELCEKHEELEKLRNSAKDEHSHYLQVEAALQTLESLYTRSQEEQRSLATELKNSLKMLKDLDICRSDLEEEMKQIKNENSILNQEKVSSEVSIRNSEVEIIELKKIKERLEEEVALQSGQCLEMQKEMIDLKYEITGLNTSYKALMSQLESVGLNPESIGLSVKDLKDENIRLRLICEKDRDEENMKKKLTKKNAALEISLTDVTNELEGSRKKVEELENSFEFLHGEKTALLLEKTILLSQLHVITVNMQKLMDQSNVLENSLSSVNLELENLREKSKNLEVLCDLLNTEKSNLITERSFLISQLESVQKRLETLENRFTQFEERYGLLEKEKETGRVQIQELISSLTIEKQERESFMALNQARIDELENQVHHLHEDSKSRKEEFQEELDKAVIAQFENFMLHKFIKDVEEKNYALSVENEKHLEASKLADKLISELETEILEQQVEEELLLVEVENLRLGIYQVFLSLEMGLNGFSDGSEPTKISVEEIIHNIKDMKRSVLKEEYDKQQLLVENDIILTLLKQINTDYRESELQKTSMMNEYEIMSDDFMKVKKENLELIEANRVLTIEVGKVSDLQSGFIELKEEYASKVDETRVLSNDISNLIEENRNLGLELDMLHEELEERKNIEENLNSELQERKNVFELWDAEATSFIFDLQISSTRDILFEHKVRELTEVCESLEGETAMKNLEIEEMKRKETAMEGEIESLRSQLMAYTPVIGSLKDNMTSLEKSFFGMENLIVLENRKSEDLDLKVHPDDHHLSDPNLMESPKSLKPSGISDLIDFQTRISALEKVIVEDMTVRRKSIEIDTKRKSVKEETEDPKRNKSEKLRGKRYLTLDNLNLTKPKPEISGARKGVPIRDIPLDQASDGSSSTNSRTQSRKGYLRTDNMMILDEMKPKKLPYEPQIEDLGVDKLEIPKTESGPIIISNQETQKGKLLQRLSSDAQKLANLETTVKDLTKRLESGKKGKKGNGVDYETVKEQLEEAEESILRLVNVNVESAASIEKNPSLAAWVEQEGGWKESEKIKRVQVEVQKIQYVLMKLDEEKKGKGKSRFSRTRSRTSVILRDFIHRGSGRSAMGRRRLCGCFTPSATKGDRIKM